MYVDNGHNKNVFKALWFESRLFQRILYLYAVFVFDVK